MTAPVDDRPEYLHYEDEGCEVAAKCQYCPLPQCKYDDPAWYRSARRMAADVLKLETIELYGLSVSMAAVRFSVTVRTVFRVLRRCREASDEQLERAAIMKSVYRNLEGENGQDDNYCGKASCTATEGMPEVRAAIIPAALDAGRPRTVGL